MKNSAYWQKRFKEIEESQHKQGQQCYADVENEINGGKNCEYKN